MNSARAARAMITRPLGWKLCIAASCILSSGLNAQLHYRVSTYAGTPRPAAEGQPPLTAPSSIARDSRGNLYISDPQIHVIHRISPDGRKSIFAGTGYQGFTGNGGFATAAKLSLPSALALDGDKFLYFVENDILRIRRIDLASGIISHVAGDGTIGFSGEGLTAINSNFGGPISALAVDTKGDLFIGDTTNYRIRKLSAIDGRLTTVAGNGTKGTPPDLASALSPIGDLTGLAVHPGGDLYFAEQFIQAGTTVPSNIVRRIRRLRNGQIVTVANSSSFDLAFNQTGSDLYWTGISEIWKLNLQTTQVASAASNPRWVNSLGGIAIEPGGALLMIEKRIAAVSRISTTGLISTVASGVLYDQNYNGPAATAIMKGPYNIKGDSFGTLWYTDNFKAQGRYILTSNSIGETGTGGGMIATAGILNANQSAYTSLVNVYADGYTIWTGISAASWYDKSFTIHDMVYSNRSRTMYLAVTRKGTPPKSQVLRVEIDNPAKQFEFLGQNAGSGGDGGPLLGNVLDSPQGLALDAADNLYVLDTGNRNIRVVINGVLSTFRTDESFATARNLVVDSAGAVWVTNSNSATRYFSDGVTVTNRIGSPDPAEFGYSDRGRDGTLARFDDLNGIARRPDGSIFLSDGRNHVIRKLTPVRFARLEALSDNPPANPPAKTFLARVRVVGQDGQPISGFPVGFSAAAGTTLSSPTADTNIDGIASIQVSLPASANVVATVPTLPGLTIQVPGASPTGPIIASVAGPQSFAAIARIAPGSWVEITGANLSSQTAQWSEGDFNNGLAPTSLAGVSIKIDGKSAYVQYVSPAQINCIVPDGIVTRGVVTVIVENQNGASNPHLMDSALRVPILLAPSSFRSGTKQYVVGLFSDGYYAGPENLIAGAPFRSAAPGDRLLLYGVGFGATKPAYPAGLIPTTTAELPNVKLSLAGLPATLEYAGLAPGSAGLYQFNFIVPEGISGDAALSMSVDGIALTQQLFLAVR